MEFYLLIVIAILAGASYLLGLVQMLRGSYKPSTFSRIVWLLLGVNGFAGVLLSSTSTAAVLLAGISLLGSAAMCVLSFWKGVRTIGKLEYVCIVLLIVSGLIWIFFEAPLVNLFISLFAHFIGAVPTYKKVWLEPKSESWGFWSLFFFASVLSIFASPGSSIKDVVFPIYFSLFDGSIFFLSLRRKVRV